MYEPIESDEKKNGIHAFALEPSLFFNWIIENNNLTIYVFVFLVADRECFDCW